MLSKCLTPEHEDLNSKPRDLTREFGIVLHVTVIPAPGGYEDLGSLLVY